MQGHTSTALESKWDASNETTLRICYIISGSHINLDIFTHDVFSAHVFHGHSNPYHWLIWWRYTGPLWITQQTLRWPVYKDTKNIMYICDLSKNKQTTTQQLAFWAAQRKSGLQSSCPGFDLCGVCMLSQCLCRLPLVSSTTINTFQDKTRSPLMRFDLNGSWFKPTKKRMEDNICFNSSREKSLFMDFGGQILA